MFNSNLVEVLRTLTRDEFDSFIEFVPWALHKQPSKRNEAIKLLNIIVEYYPEFDHSLLTKEKIFNKMFPGKPFVELKIDKIMVNLTKCLRMHFLTLRYQDPKNEFNHHLEICQFYKEKGLSARYQQSFRQLETYFNEHNLLSLEHAYKRFQIEYEKLDWFSITNDHKTDINLGNTLIELQQFTEVNTLDLLIRYALQLRIVKFDTPSPIQAFIDTLFNQTNKINDPLHHTYREIFNIFYAPKVTHQDFESCLNLIRANEKVFDYDTLYTFHVYLRNLCTLLINQGDRVFSHTLFELQKQSIDAGFHFYKGKISPSSFVSAVITALTVQKVEWTQHFIETYKNKIIGETVDKVYTRFCWAHFLYHNGQFEEVLDFLPQNLKEISYVLIARRLEIKAFYEFDLEVAIFKTEAFRTYVSRLPNRNFPAVTISYNANFARFLFQILQMPLGVKERACKIIERIAERRFVSDREWLYEIACKRGHLHPDEAEIIIRNTPVLVEDFESQTA